MQKNTNIEQTQVTSTARLSWPENGLPFSERFQDFYYSREDGREETREVFLAGNGLPGRWQGHTCFTVAELGFGTGLNVLETWHVWCSERTAKSRLTFVSFEAYPMSEDEMARAHSPWPTLEPLSRELLSRWPASSGGVVEVDLDAQTTLRVFVGSALEGVRGWQGLADAWYLDGFAPDRNPDMWSVDLMRAVFERTASDGTFSTYTSAGWVRRNLQDAGFEVARVSGFGKKRHRLEGRRP